MPFKYKYKTGFQFIIVKLHQSNTTSSIMKTIALLVVLVAVVYAEEKYTTKYDNIDLDEIIKSDRLMSNYVNCLLDKGRCSADGKTLKEIIPDALVTDCSKCNPNQKEGARKIINHLYKNKNDWWNSLTAKYDPQGVYLQKHKAELEAL